MGLFNKPIALSNVASTGNAEKPKPAAILDKYLFS